MAGRITERLRRHASQTRQVAGRVEHRVPRPAGQRRKVDPAVTAESRSTSGNRCAFVCPRLNRVTSCPAASAVSTNARPTNLVPPMTKMRISEA
jgi:hypothetical protein